MAGKANQRDPTEKMPQPARTAIVRAMRAGTPVGFQKPITPRRKTSFRTWGGVEITSLIVPAVYIVRNEKSWQHEAGEHLSNALCLLTVKLKRSEIE
jgi:hypothetical protein